MKKQTPLLTLLTALSATVPAAEDWPGIYGPGRNHTSNQKPLVRTWPPEGPKTLWTVLLNAGFGGRAVSAGRVYLLDRDEAVGDKLHVLDLTTGKQLWSFAYDAPGKFMFSGSRTTPSVDDAHVYTVGPMGHLHAISTETRKPVWAKNIWKDFGGGPELPRWGIVQNPLIYGDLLIVAPQTPEAGVVAPDKRTGALQWRSPALSGIPGYVTPSIVNLAGEDHLVMITAAVGRGRNARDGSVNGLYPRSGTDLATLVRMANDDFGQAEPARFAANAFAAIGAPVYFYRFSCVPAAMRGKMQLGAPHGGEIPFVFGTLSLRPEAPASPQDLAVSCMMQSYWVNFARKGDPNGPGLPRWPRHNPNIDFHPDGSAGAIADPRKARLDIIQRATESGKRADP